MAAEFPNAGVAPVRIRPARADEAGLLGQLALRSKAHWAYDQEFLDACRAELMFEAAEVPARRIHVAEVDDRVLGFYSLDGEPPEGEIGNMWVEPAAIGSGLGRRLWRHAVELAERCGYTVLRIDADPYAEGFYLAMGAVRVGQSPSGSIPGRMLPMLQYNVN
jgi:GNAT superfamily N-acetyltransferase